MGWRRRLVRWGLRGAVLFALAYWGLPWTLKLPAELRTGIPTSPLFLDREGNPLRRPLWNGDFRHTSMNLAEIPQLLVDATLAAEDSRFYLHGGVDPLSLGRSLRDRAGSDRFTSGGSTISQQLIKISSPRGPRDFMRKLREMLLARQLEMRWTKAEILEAYLNRLDYGNLTRGCHAAAQAYFQKDLQHLSTAEHALLAGLPQGPSRLDPFRHPEAARKRRDWVLGRMLALGMLSPEHYAAALAEPLTLAPMANPNSAGHAVDLLAPEEPPTDNIPTTIDSHLQQAVERIVAGQLAKLSESGADIAAAVVIENASGDVLALVGSQDYAALPFNATTARRSPGSTLKPFTYALALEHGYHPASLLADVPTRYRSESGLVTFNNYDRRHRGPILFAESLACSLNLPTLSLLNSLGGPEPLHQLLIKAGVRSLDKPAQHYGLGLTLGNAEITLLELTTAYTLFPQLGKWRPCRLRRDQAPAPSVTLLSPQAAWLITDILSDNAARSAAFGIQSVLRLPFSCAVKTGTSTDFRDNWCVGYTSDYTAGVWMGNTAGRPLQGISGVAGSGPIFQQLMLELHRDQSPRSISPPGGLTQVTIDTRSGTAADDEKLPSLYHRKIWVHQRHLPEKLASQRLNSHNQILLDPAVYSEWYASEENTFKHLYALAEPQNETEPVKILSPLPGSTYVIDPEIPGDGQRLKLVSSLVPDEALWSSPTLKIEEFSAQLTPGRHQIVVQAKAGVERRAEVWISVE
jgi:penicillin-binding protein 1C